MLAIELGQPALCKTGRKGAAFWFPEGLSLNDTFVFDEMILKFALDQAK